MYPVDLISQLEVDGMRVDVDQLFVDEGVIYRVKEKATFDREAEQIIGDDDTETIYEGKCSFYPIMARRDRFDEMGQGLIFIRQYRLIIPWTEIDVQIRDRFVMLSTRDPMMEGRDFEVRDVAVSTNVGYRRITVHDAKE